jgi:predicted signal transduction protein with EAL and GGDEF domain
LQQVARLLDQCVRETDIVTRYGGEEFVIVMPETDLNRAAFISERIRARAAAELSLTISGGVAMALDGDTPRTLLTRADSALYGAKSAGRNAIYQHNGQNIEPLSASSKLVESDDCPMDDTAEPATENHADEPTDCQAARV